MSKIPHSTDLQEVQQSLREILDVIRLLERGNIDMNFRRIINTGNAILPGDYIPLRQFKDLFLAFLRKEVKEEAKEIIVRWHKNSSGSATAKRNKMNFIEGSGVTLTLADDGPNNWAELTIAASASANAVPKPGNKYWAYWTPNATDTSIGDFIIGTITGTNTITRLAASATEGVLHNNATSATLDDAVVWTGEYTASLGGRKWRTGRNIIYQARCGIGELTDARFFCGVSDSMPGTLTDTPAGKTAAFRFSSSVPDTNYMAITQDGGATTVINTTVVADTSTHLFEIRFLDSVPSVEFYIDSVLKATSTTNLPSSANMVQFIGRRTLAAAIKNLRIGFMYAEADK